jgi:hypothetical protein
MKRKKSLIENIKLILSAKGTIEQYLIIGIYLVAFIYLIYLLSPKFMVPSEYVLKINDKTVFDSSNELYLISSKDFGELEIYN